MPSFIGTSNNSETRKTFVEHHLSSGNSIPGIIIAMSRENKPSDAAQSFEQRAAKRSSGIVREFWDFLRTRKKWWLTPIILLLLLISALIILGGTAAAPFIYTLF
jgi:hypothetical protein